MSVPRDIPGKPNDEIADLSKTWDDIQVLNPFTAIGKVLDQDEIDALFKLTAGCFEKIKALSSATTGDDAPVHEVPVEFFWEKIRSLFPVKGGDPSQQTFRTYLNYAFSFPTDTRTSQQLVAHGHRTTLGSEKLLRLIERDYKIIADFIGAQTINSLALRESCTDALSAILGFQDLKGKKGNIVVTEDAYSALADAALLLERAGLHRRTVRASDFNKGVTLDDIIKSGKVDKRTRLILATHVSNITGLISPIEKICEFANSFQNGRGGIRVLIDGAAAVGQVPVDINEYGLGHNFYAFSGGKCSYAARPSGVLYIPQQLIGRVNPASISEAASRWIGRSRKEEDLGTYKKWWKGLSPHYTLHALALALGLFNAIGQKNLYSHNSDLIRYFVEKMQSDPELVARYRLINPTANAGVCTFTYMNYSKNPEIYKYLERDGIIIQLLSANEFPHLVFGTKAPLSRYKDKHLLRMSVHAPSSREDVDLLLDTLKRYESSKK